MEQRYENSEPHPESPRFEMDAETADQVRMYQKNRLLQMLAAGEDLTYKGDWELLGEWGVRCSVTRFKDGNEQQLHTVYVFKSHRGQKHYGAWAMANKDKTIITIPDCDIENFLKAKGISYVLTQKPNFPEYDWIEKFYGDKKARRSGVHLMNHIDEGLYILNVFKANDLTKRAYAIHPMLQDDSELSAFWKDEEKMNAIDKRVLTLALEYRNIANAYLSYKPSTTEIKLSPLPEVNMMLIADKVQNRKDFELYHKGTHPRSDRLAEYFSQWLTALGVSEEKYQEVKSDILHRVGDL
mmetsp:Transcript_18220/g.25512  ORF Transcript_18220/g.25512 Transcript_18220/m.25512 type:complete len:297 (-) Transcript_18220:28-918(-)